MRRQTYKRTNYWKSINNILVYGRHSVLREPLKLSQSGGASVTITLPDDSQKTFMYVERKEGSEIFITGADVGKRTPCFVLQIQKKSRQNPFCYAILENITKGTACSIDNTATSDEIVRAAVEIATERGALWIELQDESSICKDMFLGIPSISLADYYFLTRGYTWYESIYTFLPDRRFLAQVQRNRKILQTKRWEDVIREMEKEDPDKVRRMMAELPPTVKSSQLLTEVLQQISPEKRCSFFDNYTNDLLVYAGMMSLRGVVWYYPLKNGIQRP